MEKITVMISEEEVNKRIREIGEQITKDYEGKELLLICVLRGGSFFMCELAKRINLDVKIDFMSVSSYGKGTASSGHIKIIKDLEPASLALCTLLDKPDRRVVEVPVDYTGFQIPDYFVVGYGLDYNQRHRNLPYIGKVEIDNEVLK